MTCGENMARLMRATGVYKLPGGTPADWELAAYQAGFGVIEQAMAALEKELFVLTAPAGRLAAWELLFRRQSSAAPLPVRRTAAAKALGLRFGPATLESIRQEVLPAAGLSGSVSESEGKLLISAALQGVTEAEARRLLDRLLPAHLEWELTVTADP